MNCSSGKWNDFCVDRGSSFFRSIQLQTISGTPLDLSGYFATGVIEASYEGPFLATFDTSISDPPASGILTFGLTPQQSSILPVTQALYYINVVGSGDASTVELLEGYFSIYP